MSSILNDLKLMFFKKDLMMRLILINVIVFVFALLVNVFCLLLQLPNPVEYIIREFLMLPSNLKTLAYTPWSIITYMFLHSGIFHILFNMLVLYWFGHAPLHRLNTSQGDITILGWDLPTKFMFPTGEIVINQ